MNFAHIHLVLTHLPIVGMFLSLFLIVYALWRKNQGALDIALVGVLLSGMAVLPVFWSGEAAEDTVEHLPGILESAIDRHGDAAVSAAVLAVIAAGVALVTLLMRRRRMPWVRWGQGAVLLTGVLAVLSMGWTANLGGLIRHPEIAGGAALQNAGEGREGREGGIALPFGKRDDDDDDHDRHGGKKDDD